MRELLRHPKAILLVFGLTMGGTTAFYTYTTYMPTFLVNTVKLTRDQATQISFITLVIYAALQPVFGAISDRIGRRSSPLRCSGARDNWDSATTGICSSFASAFNPREASATCLICSGRLSSLGPLVMPLGSDARSKPNFVAITTLSRKGESASPNSSSFVKGP